MSLKKLLTSSQSNAQMIYEVKFHQYLMDWRDKRQSNRASGFHASALTDKNFCLMKAVLEELVGKKEENFSPKTLSTFMTGDHVHQKHQEFYRNTGIADYIEQTFYSEFLDMTATPDAIINFMGRKTVVEIKSMNGFEFNKLVEPPKGAVAQTQIYMYIVGVGKSIIVVEDKNFQAIKVFSVDLNLTHALKYVRRRRAIMTCVDKKIIPVSNRRCKSEKTNKRCKYNSVCWSPRIVKLGRTK